MILEQIPRIHVLTFFLTFWGYFIFSYYMGPGQTIGKMIFHLRVRSRENKNNSLTLPESIYRTAGHFFCYIFGLFLLAIPYIQDDKRGIPDWCSNTQVFWEDDPLAVEDTIPPQLELFSSEEIDPQNDLAA